MSTSIQCICVIFYVLLENPRGKFCKMYCRHLPEGIPFHGIPIRQFAQQTNNHFLYFCNWSEKMITKYILVNRDSKNYLECFSHMMNNVIFLNIFFIILQVSPFRAEEDILVCARCFDPLIQTIFAEHMLTCK